MKAWICRNKYSDKIELFFDKPEKHWKKVLEEYPDTRNAEETYHFWSSWSYGLGEQRKITFCRALPDKSYIPEIRKIQELNPQWEDEEPIEIELNINILDDGRK